MIDDAKAGKLIDRACMFCNQSKNEVKKKKRCCFSEKIWTETLIPSFPSCPILFPYALKKNGGEGSELFIILVPRIKINGCQSVEVLCNFLNFWIGIEWMGKLMHPFSFYQFVIASGFLYLKCLLVAGTRGLNHCRQPTGLVTSFPGLYKIQTS